MDVLLSTYDFKSQRCTFGPISLGDPSFAASYRTYYARQCPWLNDETRYRQPGTVVSSDEIIEREMLVDTAFYKDWLQPQDYVSALSLVVDRDDRETAFLQVLRSPSMPTFNGAEAACLGALHPHLGRALSITRELHRRQHRLDNMLTLFDKASVGLILDQNDELLCNGWAKAILAEHDGLELRHGTLKAARAAQTEALAALIGQVRTEGTKGGDIAINRPSGRRALTVLIRPARNTQPMLDDAASDVAIFIVDPSRRTQQPVSLLRQTFGLTLTEARVASRLASGESLDEIADHLQVSVGTVRNHLKRVFAKTETSRQAELVALISFPSIVS